MAGTRFRMVFCRPVLCAVRGRRRSYSQVSPASLDRLQIFESLREKQNKRAKATEAPLSIRLPDGRTVAGTAGVTTPLFVAQSVRVKEALVSTVNGELWELGRPMEADCELDLLGYDTAEGRQAAWRTGACVLSGVLETGFGAEVCREGASELGLYCDHVLSNRSLCLSAVEEKWKEAAALKLPLSRLEVDAEDARRLFQSSRLRLQLVERMKGSSITVYRCGDSISISDGPLLPHTGLLKAFKLLQLSPVTLANETEPSALMRLRGVSFPGEKDKQEWEREQEEARRRDHRRIGTFFFNDVSPGSCFFLPKGAHIYNTLTDFIKGEYRRRGFTEVVTPTLYSTALWERSGHWEHYSENMFTRVRSWKELPIRWADFGALHRNELSGALGGLTRVRRFCQDDAHIFCTPEQLETEIVSCLDFVRHQLERSLQQFGEHWELNPGDGAFYGPKIDIQIKDAIGRQHQCATIQLDFQLPIRFDLQYVGPDGQLHRPVMIHRAVLGSLERMIAILAENFGGKWPLWLSPAQVMVIPVGGDSEPYGKQVVQQFRHAGFMVDMNSDQSATLNKKIRSAQLSQYNYIFVVGEKESKSGTVNVRSRGGKQLGQRPSEEVLTSLTQLRDTRSNLEEL
ncbi:hypothetical protein fugu_010211 [Takifugu bimaculatus]|uniref:threonine--tRNA ligase n=1 Tax=Takifugu bimaculatus TaxID=433685 RepID=A0A4Z2CF42_9TELE|nr:hypothetical protein fugu_010211 [Takifugu bimaculatus]